MVLAGYLLSRAASIMSDNPLYKTKNLTLNMIHFVIFQQSLMRTIRNNGAKLRIFSKFNTLPTTSTEVLASKIFRLCSQFSFSHMIELVTTAF